MPAPQSRSQWRRLARALAFAFPYRGAVAAIFAVTLASAAINAAEPLILKYLFDELAAGRRLSALGFLVGVLVALTIVREIATAYANWQTWQTRLGIHYSLLESTVERLHRMPLGFHRGKGVGAIMTRLDRGIQGFITAVTQIVFHVFPAVLYLAISALIMLRLDWRLALLVIAFVPLPAAVTAWVGPGQNRRERVLLERWSRIYARFNEVLSGLATVRSFAMEESEKQRFLRGVHRANQVVIRGVGIDSGLGATTNLIVAAARIAALAAGGWLVLQGRITLGTLIAFLGYVGGLFGPVQGLTGVYQTIQKGFVSLDDVFAILDVPEEVSDAPKARELPAVAGEVRFEQVEFTYPAGERKILDGISFSVRPGQTLAVVGPSGSGKTTLMALLMRFYDPQSGVIRLDGCDLKMLRQRSLRRQIGMVLQDPLLFNDTVRNNIAYGRPDARLDEVEDAARAANADAFIARLPAGYDTIVGERGGRLSVGERQRIAIARALLKNPPILVLDEATSALDAESEALVQEALRRLMKDRTTFVIAHRLATVVGADRIIVLQNGCISESGTHEELMRRRGYYASLVERQTGGLISNDGETPDWIDRFMAYAETEQPERLASTV